ncbi:MobF family relaxase [Gilliamella sp. BG7]|uniref:MobF family relaxase n=1 Tax=unclassified Gilliamella TaxID=2685620 RepID=UPI003985A33D
MMTIAPIASSNGYYENNPEGNYYLDDQLQSKFVGKGAEDLGIIDKPVDKDIQDNLMKGILPTGETSKRFETKHRSGYDLTFSAPKSVSVLSLVVGDTRLIEAHKKAVEQTVGEIEKLASVRGRTEGVYTIENTNNLIVALHTHDTSRELDPQLHTHALVFNLTKNGKGDWQSLSSDKVNKTGFIESVYINQLAFGSIYRQILRNEVESMGFKTIDSGKGLWEIEGVPTDEFSKRRKQIVNEVGENATAKEREIATLSTRNFKTKVDKIELHNGWNKTLKSLMFNKDDFYNNIKPKELIISAKDTLEINQNAVNNAIELLSDSKGQLTYQDILNTALSLSAKNTGVIDEIKKNIDIAIDKNLITPLDKDKSVFISRINLEREKRIVEINENLKNKEKNINGNYKGISKEIGDFFSDKGKIGIFTGNTTFSTQIERFETLNNAAKGNNLSPLIIVKSEKVMKQYTRKGIENVISINQLNEASINSKTLMIVDNAESLSLKNFENLLTISESKKTLVALFNSKSQIGTGNGIELLKNNGTSEYKFKEINTFEVNVRIKSIADQNSRYQQLVKDFVAEQKDSGKAIIISNNEKERQVLTNLTRSELRENGLLGKKEVSIDVYETKYLSPHQKNNIENYKAGMILEHWDKKSLSSYQIVSIDKNRNTLLLEKNNKQEVVKLGDLDKSWSLIEMKTIDISTNDKLRSTGGVLNGAIKSNEELIVSKIDKKGFVVTDEKGKTHNLSFNSHYKIEHDHIKKQSSTISDDKIVFVSLSNKHLSQNTQNQLIKAGGEIRMYSPLDYEQTQKKLSRIKNITLISERLKGNEYSSVNDAIVGRKENLLTNVQKAVNTAIGISQGSNVFFSINKLISETLKTDHSLKLSDIHNEITARINQGEIHLLKTVNGLGQQIGVSDEIYQQEKKIQNLIIKGIGNEAPLLNAEQMSKANLTHLTKGQKEATTHILTSTDKFIGIQGLAGVGKTTQLKSVLQELKANNSNVEVIGLAPTHKAVYELQSVGVKAQTISSFLVEAKNEINNNSEFNLKNKLFLIDESSMIGNKNITALYEIISQYGGRGIYSGDSKQLLSIESGAAFSFLQNHTELKFSVMNDIVRQNKSLKPAVYALLKNQAEKALSVIDSINTDVIKRDVDFIQSEKNVLDNKLINKLGFDSIAEYIAKDYSSRDKHTRNNTIIVTQLNQDKNVINQEIHNELFKQGRLGDNEHKVSVLEPVLINEFEVNRLSAYGKNINNIIVIDKDYYKIESINSNSNVVTLRNIDNKNSLTLDPKNIGQYSDIALYKYKELMISENDKVLINRTNQDKGFIANSEWIVSSIDNNKMLLINDTGDSKIIDLSNKDELHFTFGYARTDHSSQGANSKFAIVFERSSKYLSSLRAAYVGVSRAMEHVVFITDNVKEWVQNVGKIEDRLSATDILEEQQLKPISTEIDKIIKDEIAGVDPKINLDEIKNKLNTSELEILKEDEIRAKVNNIIKQEIDINSINNKELVSTYSLPDVNDRKEQMVNDFINSNKDDLKINDENKELNKIIDEKTL